MSSLFTQIIRREITAYILAEDNDFIAFLDIRPLAMGHTLVVPKKEMDYIFDYDEETLSRLLIFAKKVAFAIKKCIPCKRIGMAVVGFEIAHAHIHLVPLNRINDINFSNPKLTPSEKDFQETASKIKKAFAS